jgi:hypothetical protein
MIVLLSFLIDQLLIEAQGTDVISEWGECASAMGHYVSFESGNNGPTDFARCGQTDARARKAACSRDLLDCYGIGMGLNCHSTMVEASSREALRSYCLSLR